MSPDRTGKYRKGFEPLLENVTFRPRRQYRSLARRRQCQHLRHRAGAHLWRRRILECSEDFLRACRTLADQHPAALISTEIQCGLGAPARFSPSKVLVWCPTSSLSPSDRCGIAARRRSCRKNISLGDFAGTARHDFWRRSAGLSRRLEYLAIVEEEHLLDNVVKVGGLPASTTRGTGCEVRRHPRNPRPRIHSGPRARHSRASIGGAGSGGGRALQTRPRIRSCAFCRHSCWKKACGQRHKSAEELLARSGKNRVIG